MQSVLRIETDPAVQIMGIECSSGVSDEASEGFVFEMEFYHVESVACLLLSSRSSSLAFAAASVRLPTPSFE
jgi:hypothetical protein